jgi:DNA-binding Lrp family transcriptional regulator
VNDLERKLCVIIQRGFPLESRPFRTIGEQLCISEQECLDMVRSLSARGVLRAIKPVIAWGCLGFQSVLAGAEVDEGRIEAVAERINRHPGVTHNYRRAGPLNLWFTLTYEHDDEKRSFFEAVASMEGVRRLRGFPAKKTYKIGLVLDV